MTLAELKNMDILNRTRALDLESFIVEAPAGSGKTELLIQRYLKLLSVVDEPEEIIALTFSNKATAEMRNRILQSLERATNNDSEEAAHKTTTRTLAIEALKQAEARHWNLLLQPARLRIMTIDALCSSLARQMPLLSRFGGQPKVNDDADIHYLEAARRAISEVENEDSSNNDVSTVLAYFDNDAEKLEKLLAKMLQKRDQWLPLVGSHLHVNSDEFVTSMEEALRTLIEHNLQQATQILPSHVQKQLMPIANFAASHLNEDHLTYKLLNWNSNLTANINDLPLWHAVSTLLLTKSNTLRKRLTKEDGFSEPTNKVEKDAFALQKEKFFEITKQFPELATLADIRGLPDLNSIKNNSEIIFAISELLRIAAGHLWLVFQESNEVDFVEIAHCAQTALANSEGTTDLALQLDYQISHLLIDEFQDTSPAQMRLIEQLTQGWEPDDKRTLFCVGDPMQSIYRFRKADVSLFLSASQYGIGHLRLSPLRLSYNNRSHPAVIDWINQTFTSVFPALDDAPSGAISYRPFVATRPSVEGEGVIVHPLIFKDENNAANTSINLKIQEANFVAELISQEKVQYPTHKIAVLVRSRNHLRHLISKIKLNHKHLKFQAVEIDPLNQRQSVLDALSLTYALLSRADRVHWLNILRAPWCGLTLHDLHALCADNHQATIWQLMFEDLRLEKLSNDGLQRLHHVRGVLFEAFSNQGRVPPRRWLESTWLKLGGAACLVDPGDLRDVQSYFDLFEKLSATNHLDFTQLETALNKLYAEPDAKADDTLQFLTIHKSKGLEFDTVILPALNSSPRNQDADLVLWEEVLVNSKYQLIAAPLMLQTDSSTNATPNLYKFLEDLEKKRNRNESARLLYVASTRAKHRLHLIASVAPTKENVSSPNKNAFLDLLWPSINNKFMVEPNSLPKKIPEFTHAATPILTLSSFIPQLIRHPNPAVPSLLNKKPTLKSTSTNFSAANNQPITFQQTDIALDNGSLAHLYLELIAKSGVEKWTVERLAQLKPVMCQWLTQQGHSKSIAQQGADQVCLALQTTITSPDGLWVLSPHENAMSELSLTHLISDHNAQNNRIDRTFIVDNTRWIIDYKLTSTNTFDLDFEAQRHRQQLARYSQLFPQERITIQQAVYFISLGKLVLI